MRPSGRPKPIDPPLPEEYGALYQPYVTAVRAACPLQLLDEQLAEGLALLSELDEERAVSTYQPGKWSVKEVFGHLIDVERIFAGRALWFARNQTLPLPDMNQDSFVIAGDFNQRPVESIAAEYESVRRSTLCLFESFGPRELHRRGVAADSEFTVRAVAFILAGHERHHLAILNHQYGLSGL